MSQTEGAFEQMVLANARIDVCVAMPAAIGASPPCAHARLAPTRPSSLECFQVAARVMGGAACPSCRRPSVSLFSKDYVLVVPKEPS